MKSFFKSFNITAITAALPGKPRDILDYGKNFGEREVSRISQNSGVNKIYSVCPKSTLTTLGEKAARDLIDKENVDVSTIDAVIVVSQTTEYIAPATSTILQEKLGLDIEVLAFDINYGCSGYIYGLYQAALLINAANCRNVLLIAGDVITPYLHEEDRKLKLLLSDAVTASLINKGNSQARFIMRTDGSGFNHLIAKRLIPKRVQAHTMHGSENLDDGYYHMDGAKVMEFALREIPKLIENLLDYSCWAKEDVGLYGLHQANQFILNYLIKKAHLPQQNTPIAVSGVGNTGPASIPLMLSIEGDKVANKAALSKSLLCGFGVGLSWGGVTLDLSKTRFHNPINN